MSKLLGGWIDKFLNPVDAAGRDYPLDSMGHKYQEDYERVVEPDLSFGADTLPRRRWGVESAPTADLDYDRARLGRSSGVRDRSNGNWGNNVIDLPVAQQGMREVVVLEPRTFDEMATVIQHLRDRKSVVMNLTLMDPADAQRSVDFVAGGTYAIDGHQERIGENIFLFTPNCVSVIAPNTPAQTTSDESTQAVSPQPTPIWAASSYEEPVAVGRR
jgi:cell division inhibitor SepF